MVNLYNTKFAAPAKTIMDNLTAKKLLTDQPFDTTLKWTYYELWHHEGRRARHGAAMAGPDYTWWHGLYEVSNVFYNEFIPQARELDAKTVNDVINAMARHWDEITSTYQPLPPGVQIRRGDFSDLLALGAALQKRHGSR